MTTTIQAVYENGVLRPLAPLGLSEGQQVRVTVASDELPTAEGVASNANTDCVVMRRFRCGKLGVFVVR